MTQLKLPGRMTVYVEGQAVIVYLGGDNPQPDGTVHYRSAKSNTQGPKICVVVNLQHSVVWP